MRTEIIEETEWKSRVEVLERKYPTLSQIEHVGKKLTVVGHGVSNDYGDCLYFHYLDNHGRIKEFSLEVRIVEAIIQQQEKINGHLASAFGVNHE